MSCLGKYTVTLDWGGGLYKIERTQLVHCFVLYFFVALCFAVFSVLQIQRCFFGGVVGVFFLFLKSFSLAGVYLPVLFESLSKNHKLK